MPGYRLDDLEAETRELEARMDAVVAALTGRHTAGEERSHGAERAESEDETADEEVSMEPPRGASQQAVEAAVRRVEETDEESTDRLIV